MDTKCGNPLQFDEQDWEKFDFTRWSFEDAPVDESALPLAKLAEQFLTSPEWQANVTGAITGLKDVVREQYTQRVADLESRKEELSKTLEERTAVAKAGAAALRDRIKQSGGSPVLTADPDTYQLSAKVLDEDTKLGLPGLTVRLIGPQKKVLAEATTDEDGNAVLYLDKAQADALAKEKFEANLEVSTPSGKAIHKAAQAVCPRSNFTESYVAAVKSTKEVQPHAALAGQLKTEREARLADLQGKPDRLKAEYDATVAVLDCRLEQAHAVLADLDGKTDDRQPRPSPEKPRKPARARAPK